ncbi:MBL fold metallo-hydrolase, partial [Candidatus Bathyarchaeota archaeon]|nr:MBL fold metallo-hydrolase [Candidatus Bathyarchaeota archaeon]
LDHSGGAPIFYLSEKKPIFATPVTAEIVKILIKDFIKLSGYYLPFEYLELESMMRQRKDLTYGMDVKFKDVEFRLINAGHIPGSAMVELNTNGKRILYTGDFNTLDSKLVNSAKIPKQTFDAVIIESTYATEDHPSRRDLEEEFIREILKVIEDEGRILVPAFAVGRSQEMLMMLNAHNLSGKTVVDGMARLVNMILMDHTDYIRAPKDFIKTISETREIKGWKDRREAVKKARVIVAPSGMLEGGNALFYLEKLALDERNAVFLVSYQIPGSGGAKLLETGMFNINEHEEKVRAKVRRFDFSSHAGKTELEAFLKGLNGKPKIFVIHGEPENCEALASYARDELNLDAVAPNLDEEFSI